MAAKRRVLVVDDSITVRKHIVKVLAADPEIEVVGEASDGRTAIEQCRRLRPDVMTLDMMMPHATGLEVTEQVMGYFPTPILIVSASLNRGEAVKTLDALAAGAVDVLDKPRSAAFDPDWESTLCRTVKVISRVPVITHPRARLAVGQFPSRSSRPPAVVPWSAPRADADTAPALVAIGASTGGPAALVEILRELPASFPTPIVIVIHMSRAFLGPFVEWLDGHSALTVRVAKDGELLSRLGPGTAVVAPADRHLLLRGQRLQLNDAPERHSCRPSIDVLFESIAHELGPDAIGCLLTGMGRDGASGLHAMLRAGARTLAQDEASSVVYGMPRHAVAIGAAEQVLDLGEFAPTLRTLCERRGSPKS